MALKSNEMYIENGLVSIIRLSNFITQSLLKDDIAVKRTEEYISFSQSSSDGTWVMLPEWLNEVIIVPKGFKVGKIRKSDLIKLYDELQFVVKSDGAVKLQYSESYIVPEVFGFSIYSRYPLTEPGVKLVNTFKFKVRNKLGLILN